MTARQEYLGRFPPPDPAFDAAFEVWLEYYVDTERYDRTLPGGWSHRDPDTWLPKPHVMSYSIAFARNEHANLAQRVLDRGFEPTREQMDRAKGMAGRLAGRLSLDAQEELLRRIRSERREERGGG